MRAHGFICSVIGTMLLCGCDPAGLPRLQLQLRTPPTQNGIIAVDSPDTQEALQILDAVVGKHGFNLAEADAGFIRVYMLRRPPVTVDGRVYTMNIFCRVKLTSTGLLVTFGEFGFLPGHPPEVASLFADVRSAFKKRYGGKSVRSHQLGRP
jgi:hypothetical protein